VRRPGGSLYACALPVRLTRALKAALLEDSLKLHLYVDPLDPADQNVNTVLYSYYSAFSIDISLLTLFFLTFFLTFL